MSVTLLHQIAILGWGRRIWCCLCFVSWACLTLGPERCLAQQETRFGESVTVGEVMEWLVNPPAIADMLGVRVNAIAGEIPTVSSDSLSSQEGGLEWHHMRWDAGKFFTRILLKSGDYNDLLAVTEIACGGVHPHYWAISEGSQLTCIESSVLLDRGYVGEWTERSVGALLVVAAQKKIQEFLNLGLLRIQPGSISWARTDGRMTALSIEGNEISGLLEIGSDGVLEAVQYWMEGEPLPQLDLRELSKTDGNSQAFNAFRVSYHYGEKSKDWRIPTMFEVSNLVSVEQANAVDPSLPEGGLKAHSSPFVRYQVKHLESSDTPLPDSAFTHHQISGAEGSPIDMKYTIYSSADGHFRKGSDGSLIPLRTVTEKNASRLPGQRNVTGRAVYVGVLVLLGLGFLWAGRAMTKR